MPSKLKAQNPFKDSGEKAGTNMLIKTGQYALWFLMALVSVSLAFWAFATGKEKTGMDSEENFGNITIK